MGAPSCILDADRLAHAERLLAAHVRVLAEPGMWLGPMSTSTAVLLRALTLQAARIADELRFARLASS